jgi:hypothetical protein
MMGCDRVANVSSKFVYEGGADDVQGDDDQERRVRVTRPSKEYAGGRGRTMKQSVNQGLLLITRAFLLGQ